MENLYYTILDCETSDTLLNLMDPEKLIVETKSQFSYSKQNELIFESQNDTMHKDIILLSEKIPEEVFTAIYYKTEVNNETQFNLGRYENGSDEFLGYMPKYAWENYVEIIKASGEEEFYNLWKRIRKYLFWNDETRGNILDGVLGGPIPHNHYDQCVSVYVSVSAEHENFKITVDKTKNSNLSFRGYQRDSEFKDWKEIFESKNYCLPF